MTYNNNYMSLQLSLYTCLSVCTCMHAACVCKRCTYSTGYTELVRTSLVL